MFLLLKFTDNQSFALLGLFTVPEKCQNPTLY